MPCEPNRSGRTLGTRSHPDQRGATLSVPGARIAPSPVAGLFEASTDLRFAAAAAGARRQTVAMTTIRGRLLAAAMVLAWAGAATGAVPAVATVQATAVPEVEALAPARVASIAPAPATLALPAAADTALDGWEWPVSPRRIAAPYVAPPHRYGPGHRGIDLASEPDAEVRAPAAGMVAFVGAVAGRAVVTIDHGDGLVTTLEPVAAVAAVGDTVAQGDLVGRVDVGGHAAPGTVHFGVRRDGEYINPMLLLAGVPRAVLLPCC